jgi:hypothetical protein
MCCPCRHVGNVCASFTESAWINRTLTLSVLFCIFRLQKYSTTIPRQSLLQCSILNCVAGSVCLYVYYSIGFLVRLHLKRDGTRAETRFHLSAKRSLFKSVGASVQSTTGSRDMRISGGNAGYTSSEVVWRVLATHSLRQFPLHFPSVLHSVPSRFNWTLHQWSSCNSDYIRAWPCGDRSRVRESFSKPVQTGPKAQPAFCNIGIESFLGFKQPELGADQPPFSSTEVAND